ncbi:flagellar hook protein FlgE [Kiloniella laminariae]|uniref:flagellar hook protein FlgE n=1 Tax=Kiloniella laminariae TaxID=454162 RepID=UPI0003A65890|nr:flagellar hook protein FlgE [Kiloniella laminariae]
MSIYGALYSGVSGLSAQSNAMGMISDNISNVNTIGYKGVSARFSTLVAQSASQTKYSPGGVRSAPLRNVDKQGQLQATAAATDLAVAGNGFFVVSDRPNAGTNTQYLFTRAGSFRPDASGDLVNAGGYYLQGWPITAGSTPPTSAATTAGLATVNISNLNGAARPTTNLELGLNLPSTGAVPVASTGITMQANLSSTALVGATETVSTVVYDSLGNAQTTSFLWTKTAADQWSVTPQNPTINGVASGTVAGGPYTVDFSPATGLPIAPVPAVTPNYTWNSGAAASPLTVDIGSAGSTNRMTQIGTVFNATQILQVGGTAPAEHTATVQVFDDLGNAHNMDLLFRKTGSNTWEMFPQNPTLNGTSSGTVTPAIRTITFASGRPATITMPDLQIAWNPAIGAAASTIALDPGTIGQADGITQFSGNFVVTQIEQDGVTFGNFRGVSISDEGIVTALFDNGEQLDISQLPLALFPNPNGLEGRTGNAFSPTSESGNFLLNRPKIGGAGLLASASLEASNIDLAEEFTNMIVTQRAYSASAKIITTADEMLDELIRIAR